MMRALFSISLLELFIGGGGRLTAVGPVSLRMVLFAACLCATLVAILFPRRHSDGVQFAMLLVLMYLLVHVAGIVVGSINGAPLSQMITEFQQSLYWLAGPFFALMLQSERDVQRAARLVRIAGITLACAYIGILIGLLTGVIHLGSVRAIVGPSGEIRFKSGEFFIYKGFLYLGVSIVFFVAMRPKYWAALVTLIGLALAFTFTRGLLISTAVAVLLMLCFQGRWRAAIPVLFLAASAAFLLWIYLPSTDTKVSGNYEASTGQRLEDMTFMAEHATPSTLLVGEGFGSFINNRLGIENTFLFVLWKLGVLGLLFWLLPLFLCAYYYSKILHRRSNPVANAYLFGTILVYVQTTANPFLNNPIGLSFVMLALFSLRTLSRRGPQPLALGGAPDTAVGMNV
jgi:hypothetical protein